MMAHVFLSLTVNKLLTPVNHLFTLPWMIKTFKHKGLKELFETGSSRKVKPMFQNRCRRLMDMLDESLLPEDMNIPGFRFHGLQGNPKRYSVTVNGNYRITFGWDGTDAVRVDLEDYH